MKTYGDFFSERLTKVVNEDTHQADFQASQIGYNRKSLYNWMNRKKIPSVHALVKIALHYNVSTDWLLGLSNDREVR